MSEKETVALRRRQSKYDAVCAHGTPWALSASGDISGLLYVKRQPVGALQCLCTWNRLGRNVRVGGIVGTEG